MFGLIQSALTIVRHGLAITLVTGSAFFAKFGTPGGN